MPKLLYITCNQKPAEASRSLSVGKAFLDEYRKRHPDAGIEAVDLYRHDMPRVDADVLSAWSKMRSGQGEQLTKEEQGKADRLVAHAAHFASFDRYVFVTPMWNLGFPAEVKMYIDAVCIAGQTFRYTATGPVGILRGKKCLNIHSSGGFHNGKPEDYSVPYLKTIMGFMGVDDFRAVVVEGVDALPDKAEEFRRAAIEEARAIAEQF